MRAELGDGGVRSSFGLAPAQLGLRTIGDIAHTPKSTLQRALGARAGGELWELAWGIDTRRVIAHTHERSVGSQETFDRDTDDLDLIGTELLRLSARVASRMRAARLVGRTVTLGVRFADFRSITRSLTLRAPTDVTSELHVAALSVGAGRGLRVRDLRLGGGATALRADP